MAQVFAHSNNELGSCDLTKTTTGSIDNWGLAGDLTSSGALQEDDKVDFSINLLYMLSSLGFVTFRDFEEHFASCFIELKSAQQVSVFKSNFFTFLAAILQISLETHVKKVH